MSLLLLCFEPATTAASMAMDRPRAIGDAPALRAGAQWRTPLWRLSCLARNGRKPRGRKSHRRRCGSDDRGAAALRPDQAIKEATCVRVLNHNSGRRLGWSRFSCARGRNGSAQKQKQSAGKGGIVPEKDRSRERVVPPQLCGRTEICAAGSKHSNGDSPSPLR